MKMSFGTYIFIPIFIAIQAFTLMLIASYIPLNEHAIGVANPLAEGGGIGLIVWVSFQAWAMYFMAGCTPKTGVKTLLGYAGGIIASVAIFELGFVVFANLNIDGGTAWGLYLAVFLVVIPVICVEKVPWFDFVPAYFVGAGVFFALMTYHGAPPVDVETGKAIMGKYAWYGTLALAEMVACAVGLIYGAITVSFRGCYEAKFGEKIEETDEEKGEEKAAVE